MITLMDFTDFAARTGKYFISTSGDILKLLNPSTVDPTMKNMKALPMWFLRLYLIVIAVPFFIGYFLYFYEFQLGPYSLENSFKLAFRDSLIAILVPVVMGYVLYLFDVRLVKKKVSYAEAVTLFTYALGLGIISGIFRISIPLVDTWILHLFIMMYSIYLVYSSMGSRFGYEKIILPFMFIILSGFLAAVIIFVILGFALMIPSGYTGF